MDRSRIARLADRIPLDEVLLFFLFLGIVFRTLAPFLMEPRADGGTYSAQGHAWARTGTFLMPYGDVTTIAPTGPGPSHHYPPLYPLYLGIWYKALGFGLDTTRMASLALSMATLLVVYATTLDLWGRRGALFVVSAVALDPDLVLAAGINFSENLVVLLFVLTLWAILKGLKDSRYWVAAGLFAGLTYLARSTLGAFFFVAGAAGLFWRVRFRGWKVLLDPWYGVAVGVFSVPVLLWAWRNVSLFGFPNWETSAYLSYIESCLAGVGPSCSFPPGRELYSFWEAPPPKISPHPFAAPPFQLFLHALLVKAPLFLSFVLSVALFFPSEVRRFLRSFRSEVDSGLLLSVGLVLVLGWVMASIFWSYEGYDPWWLDNRRYFVPALPILLWGILRHSPMDRTFLLRALLFLLVLSLATVQVFLSPQRWPEAEAARHLDPLLSPQDEVAIDGNLIKYSFYPYLTHPESIQVYGWEYRGDREPRFILSLVTKTYPGYRLLGTYSQSYSDGGVLTATLWEIEKLKRPLEPPPS